MLSHEDLVTAVANNIKSWDWDINTKFSLNEEEAKAVLTVLELHKDMMKDLSPILDKMKGAFDGHTRGYQKR
jgi:hypothetical protein